VLEDFRAAEPAILRLFEADDRLDAESRTRTVCYLEALFDDIETDERAERRFLRHCRRP
jgi:hypothetical protein